MQNIRRSSKEWFRIWDSIISLEDTLSRIELSEKSQASIQTIQKLQTDWMMQNDIIWDGRYFKHYKSENISLSLFVPATDKEKEQLK